MKLIQMSSVACQKNSTNQHQTRPKFTKVFKLSGLSVKRCICTGIPLSGKSKRIFLFKVQPLTNVIVPIKKRLHHVHAYRRYYFGTNSFAHYVHWVLMPRVEIHTIPGTIPWSCGGNANSSWYCSCSLLQALTRIGMTCLYNNQVIN